MKLKVDGTEYELDIVGIDISANFLYRYAERVDSGDFKADAIGVFENQTLVINPMPTDDFIAFYRYIITQKDKNFNVDIDVFSPTGIYTFSCYPKDFTVSMKRLTDDGEDNWYNKVTFGFVAVSKKVV